MGRVVYYQDLSPEQIAALVDRGLEPIDLLTLPRETEDDQRRYLLAKSQAIEEGFAPVTMQIAKIIELQMRALGMLHKDENTGAKASVSVTSGVLKDLLDWGSDRHTLANNSTVQSAKLGRDKP